jgi:hypothetical protein
VKCISTIPSPFKNRSEGNARFGQIAFLAVRQ